MQRVVKKIMAHNDNTCRWLLIANVAVADAGVAVGIAWPDNARR